MDEKTSSTHATYKTSEVARELGISAEWLRKGESGVSSRPLAAIPGAATATTPAPTWSGFAVGERDAPRGCPVARPSEQAALEAIRTLTSRIEKLALEEHDAVRCRDWPAARNAAEERAALQEARQRAAARRLA